MASYDIKLTDGTTLTTINNLENDGVGNQSTPKEILSIQFGPGTNKVVIAGNLVSRFIPNYPFEIVGGSAYDGTYTTHATELPVFVPDANPANPGTTIIPINELLPTTSSQFPLVNVISVIPSGPNTFDILFRITGDQTATFPVGTQFVVKDNDFFPFNSFVVDTVSFNGSETEITVKYSSNVTPTPTTIGSLVTPVPATPFGNVQYSVPYPSTSLELIGKGSPIYNNNTSWGHAVHNNNIHMMEHFANNIPPVAPLEGQMWYQNDNQVITLFTGDPVPLISFSVGAFTWTVAGDITLQNKFQPGKKIVIFNDTGLNQVSHIFTVQSLTFNAPNTDITVIETIDPNTVGDGKLYALEDWKPLDFEDADFAYTVSALPPPSPNERDQWLETGTGCLYQYAINGASMDWVLIGCIGGLQLPNYTVSALPPASPNERDQWLETGTGCLYQYAINGASMDWVLLGCIGGITGGGGGTIPPIVPPTGGDIVTPDPDNSLNNQTECVITTSLTQCNIPIPMDSRAILRSIHVVNLTGSQETLDVEINYGGSNPISIAKGIPIAANGAEEILFRAKVLGENDTISIQGSANNALTAVLTWQLIDDTTYFGAGVDVTTTTFTDLYTSTGDPTEIESILIANDSTIPTTVTVAWTDASDVVQAYLSFNAQITPNSNMELIQKAKRIPAGHKIRVLAADANAVEVHIAGRLQQAGNLPGSEFTEVTNQHGYNLTTTLANSGVSIPAGVNARLKSVHIVNTAGSTVNFTGEINYGGTNPISIGESIPIAVGSAIEMNLQEKVITSADVINLQASANNALVAYIVWEETTENLVGGGVDLTTTSETEIFTATGGIKRIDSILVVNDSITDIGRITITWTDAADVVQGYYAFNTEIPPQSTMELVNSFLALPDGHKLKATADFANRLEVHIAGADSTTVIPSPPPATLLNTFIPSLEEALTNQLCYNVTTSLADSGVAISPGKKGLINSIFVTNNTATPTTIKAEINYGGTNPISLTETVTISPNASQELILKFKVMGENDTLSFQASQASALDVVVSWAEISDSSYVGTGVDLTNTNITDLYVSNGNPTAINSILAVNDGPTNTVVDVLITDASNIVQSYLASGLALPNDSNIEILQNPKWLPTGYKIRVSSPIANTAEFSLSGKLQDGVSPGISLDTRVNNQQTYIITNTLSDTGVTVPLGSRGIIRSIHIANTSASSVDVTAEINYGGSNPISLADTMPIAGNSSIDLLLRPKVMSSNDVLNLSASTNGVLYATITWEETTDANYTGGGADLTTTNLTDVYVSSGAASVLESLLIVNDSPLNNTSVDVAWTDSSDVVQGYFVKGINVPAQANIELAQNAIFLPNGHKIRAIASVANEIEIHVSGRVQNTPATDASNNYKLNNQTAFDITTILSNIGVSIPSGSKGIIRSLRVVNVTNTTASVTAEILFGGVDAISLGTNIPVAGNSTIDLLINEKVLNFGDVINIQASLPATLQAIVTWETLVDDDQIGLGVDLTTTNLTDIYVSATKPTTIKSILLTNDSANPGSMVSVAWTDAADVVQCYLARDLEVSQNATIELITNGLFLPLNHKIKAVATNPNEIEVGLNGTLQTDIAAGLIPGGIADILSTFSPILGNTLSNQKCVSVSNTLSSAGIAIPTGKKGIIQSILITNTTNTATSIKGEVNYGGTNPISISESVTVPANSSEELVLNATIMGENDILNLQAGLPNILEATISWTEIEDLAYVGVGVDLTTTNVTDLYTSTGNPTAILSMLAINDAGVDTDITVIWTDGADVIQAYLVKDLLLPANSSVELINDSKWLPAGHKIRVSSTVANTAEINLSGKLQDGATPGLDVKTLVNKQQAYEVTTTLADSGVSIPAGSKGIIRSINITNVSAGVVALTAEVNYGGTNPVSLGSAIPINPGSSIELEKNVGILSNGDILSFSADSPNALNVIITWEEVTDTNYFSTGLDLPATVTDVYVSSGNDSVINSIKVVNDSPTSTVISNVIWTDGSDVIQAYLFKDTLIPDNSVVEVLHKALVLPAGHKIRAIGGVGNQLDIHVSGRVQASVPVNASEEFNLNKQLAYDVTTTMADIGLAIPAGSKGIIRSIRLTNITSSAVTVSGVIDYGGSNSISIGTNISVGPNGAEELFINEKVISSGDIVKLQSSAASSIQAVIVWEETVNNELVSNGVDLTTNTLTNVYTSNTKPTIVKSLLVTNDSSTPASPISVVWTDGAGVIQCYLVKDFSIPTQTTVEIMTSPFLLPLNHKIQAIATFPNEINVNLSGLLQPDFVTGISLPPTVISSGLQNTGINLTTTLTNVGLPIPSGKFALINSVYITNVANTNEAVTGEISYGVNDISLSENIPVLANSALDLLFKDKLLQPGDNIKLQASNNNTLNAVVTWTEVDDPNLFGGGVDLTTTSLTDIYISSGKPSIVDSILLVNDSLADNANVTVVWTNAADVVLGYFAKDLFVPLQSSIELLPNAKYMNTGDKLKASTLNANRIEIHVNGIQKDTTGIGGVSFFIPELSNQTSTEPEDFINNQLGIDVTTTLSNTGIFVPDGSRALIRSIHVTNISAAPASITAEIDYGVSPVSNPISLANNTPIAVGEFKELLDKPKVLLPGNFINLQASANNALSAIIAWEANINLNLFGNGVDLVSPALTTIYTSTGAKSIIYSLLFVNDSPSDNASVTAVWTNELDVIQGYLAFNKTVNVNSSVEVLEVAKQIPAGHKIKVSAQNSNRVEVHIAGKTK